MAVRTSASACCANSASASLISGLLTNSASLLEEHVTATASAFHTASLHGLRKNLPYEDVYWGLLLSLLVRGNQLFAIHAGKALYLDSLESISSAAVLVHGLRSPDQVRRLEQWARTHHCIAPRPWRFNCGGREGGRYLSCSGSTWTRCGYQHNESACSSSSAKVAARAET